MQLTQESGRARWLLLFATWVLCAVMVVLHANAVREYIAVVDQLGQRPGASR